MDDPQTIEGRGQHLPSDHSLLERYRRGSQDAAGLLYLRYAHRLRGLARAQLSADLAKKVDLDDLVQSVFGSFFRGVRQGLYDVPAGEELWRLFLVIALNKIRRQGNYHHAAKRDVRRTQEIGERNQQLVSPSDEDGAFSYLQLVVEEALDKLPEQVRRLVDLRMQGFEVQEIARQTGRSKRTVERLLQQARVRLQGLLNEENKP